MAQLDCMADDCDDQAVFIATMMQSGDSYRFCTNHMVAWCAGVVAQDIGVDGPTFYEMLAEIGKREDPGELDEVIAEAEAEAAEQLGIDPSDVAPEQMTVDEAITTAEGAPTDEAPAVASSDADQDAEAVDEAEPARAKAKAAKTTGK